MRLRKLLFAVTLLLLGQVVWAAGLSVAGYVLQSSRRISPTQLELVYRATVTNPGAALNNVVGSSVSTSPATVLVKGSLQFGDVAANASAVSLDTFTVRQNSAQAFDPGRIKWTLSGTVSTPFRADFSVSPAGGYAPIDIRFTPAQIAAAVVERFDWDFNGDGVVDITDTVGRNQVKRFSTAGSYTVSLKITDSLGRSDTRVKTIVVSNAPPLVSAEATPSNGPVPLSVSFAAYGSDNDGIARYEWDFDGDGIYDRTINGTNGFTSFVYTTVGNYLPRLRVTDNLGASVVVSLPTMEVRAGSAGSPSVALSASPGTGWAPRTVRLTAIVNPSGAQRFQWDVNGDGVFDAETTVNGYDNPYTAGGTFYPRVRVTMADGRTAEDAAVVTISSTVALSISNNTLDLQLGQTVDVGTTLSGVTRASIIIERRGGGTVRTLVPMALRQAGTYTDSWNGKGDTGQPVSEGIYHAVLIYEVEGVAQRLDLSSSTGGVEFNPSRTSLPATFQPFNNNPLIVDFTLENAAEVTAFLGSYNVNSRYTTFFTRRPFGRGTHRISWNGENTEGQLIKPAPGDSFLFGLFGYTLTDSGIFVRNSAQLTALAAAPAIFDPTGIGASGVANRNAISFTLTAPASAELTVQDTLTGVIVNRVMFDGLPAGSSTLYWDGKARDGRYVAPGTYRLGVTPVQANGFRALTSYVLQRVFY